MSVGNTTPLVNLKRVTKPPTKELVVERKPAFLAVTNSLNQVNFVNESSKSSIRLGVTIAAFTKLATDGRVGTAETPCMAFRSKFTKHDIKLPLSTKLVEIEETGKEYLDVRTVVG